MTEILTALRLAIIALAAGGILTTSEIAVCQDNDCPQLGCNDELPCPGASCGCVRRDGQPFGRCVPYR